MTDPRHTVYPFHCANIHEDRLAARVARALPLGLVLLPMMFVVLGVLRYTTLLLAICAVFNVSMWLWVCSGAVFAIFGMRRVAEETQKDVAIAKAGTGETNSTLEIEMQDPIRHVVVFPTYKEEEEILVQTLTCVKEAEGSKHFWVVLAMERREGKEGEKKATNMKERFGKDFGKFLVFYHPTDLDEMHLDKSSNREVPGKASNLKWAVVKTHEECNREPSISLQNTVLTVADADCLFHPRYFDWVTEDFCEMRAADGEQQRWTMWQAPQLPFTNFWDSPAPSRVWGYISSVYEVGGVSSLSMGGHHMVFSSYSVHLQLAVDAKLWDGDVIAEDHHAYLKAFFYSIYDSAQRAAAAPAGGRPNMGCRPPLRVRPVMLPVKSTSVVDPAGALTWASWKARWDQAKRHTQGVAELSYSLLALWDLACTLPRDVYTYHMLSYLGKVVLRPFIIHTLPVCQGMAFGVISLYWVLHHRMVPRCPDRIWMASSDGETLLCGLAGAWALVWPMLVPFLLMAIANFLFINTIFTRPAAAGRDKFWPRQDGGVPEMLGSRKLSVGILLCVDCLVLMGPIMVVYGLIPELLSCWNVLWRGNHFEYVTAGKTLALGSGYGTCEETEKRSSTNRHRD